MDARDPRVAASEVVSADRGAAVPYSAASVCTYLSVLRAPLELSVWDLKRTLMSSCGCVSSEDVHARRFAPLLRVKRGPYTAAT